MDTAVSLVQSYLYMNGFFTVTEYPVLELMASGEYRNLTDVDILALRLPSDGHSHPEADQPLIAIDPALGVDEGRLDLIIAEVKEGKAELNAAGRDPVVLTAALRRFGHIDDNTVADIIKQLLEDGEAVHPAGIRVRLCAFGARPPHKSDVPYMWRLHGELTDYIHKTLTEHWAAAQTIQSKDPALAFILLMEKSARATE
ncbi:MAG: hypothetical protein IH850_10925 [Acidobacteria bacterium]|nr:hypothetical protein [Acidobacteriota bacterium]